MVTINSTEETRKRFEEERMRLIGKEARAINQDEFINILIKHWRKK